MCDPPLVRFSRAGAVWHSTAKPDQSTVSGYTHLVCIQAHGEVNAHGCCEFEDTAKLLLKPVLVLLVLLRRRDQLVELVRRDLRVGAVLLERTSQETG